MSNNHKKFSLVSYLIGEEYGMVRSLQEELFKITGSKKCLSDWLPHITVGDGILVPNNGLQKLESELEDFTHSRRVMRAKIKGFGGTENWRGAVENTITPYVIWLDVEVSADLLSLFNNLKDEITSHYDTWLPRTENYVPHITLAFADLSQEGYKKGMEYLATQTLELHFSISHIALVECFGKGNMTSTEYKKFYFKD